MPHNPLFIIEITPRDAQATPSMSHLAACDRCYSAELDRLRSLVALQREIIKGKNHCIEVMRLENAAMRVELSGTREIMDAMGKHISELELTLALSSGR